MTEASTDLGGSALVEAVTTRLAAIHGRPVWQSHGDPLDVLIGCILSQHTSDVNSGRAYQQLRAAFPEWALVAEAPVADIEAAIRPGGLAATKSSCILAVLRYVLDGDGRAWFGRLADMPITEASGLLQSLPGVGPKTAAIVLCFALGKAIVPVDTHVFRVAWRLGLVERKRGEARAHDALQHVVPPDEVYAFHVLLIRHGRSRCTARRPDCANCEIADLCARAGMTEDS